MNIITLQLACLQIAHAMRDFAEPAAGGCYGQLRHEQSQILFPTLSSQVGPTLS